MVLRRVALVVGAAPAAGYGEFYAERIRNAETVIAADGGVTVCRLSTKVPDVCIGDFDSAAPEDVVWAEGHGARIIRAPVNKNRSDLDLAVLEARMFEPTTIELTAAFSGRLDHTLASIGTLLAAADCNARGIEPNFTLYGLKAGIRDRLILHEACGRVFSVYAMARSAIISISGARYELSSARMELLSSRGLSNVTSERDTVITLHRGTALVVVLHDEETHRNG